MSNVSIPGDYPTFEPLEDSLLHDEITLVQSVEFPEADLRILRAQYDVEVTATRVYTNEDNRLMAYFEGEDILTAFIVLTQTVVQMFTGQIKFSIEDGDRLLTEDERWELIFAGRRYVSMNGTDPKRQNIVLHNGEFIIEHIWRLPSGSSILQMMDMLRSNVPYSILQQFIAQEDQNLLTPSSVLSGMTSTAGGGPNCWSLHSHIQLAKTTDIYGYLSRYEDVWIQENLGWDLLCFYQALTGKLNSFDYVWEIAPTSDSAELDLGIISRAFEKLVMDSGFEALLTSASEVSGAVLVGMPYNTLWVDPNAAATEAEVEVEA